MPNLWELESLLDLSEFNKALPDGHPFYSVTANAWSSTSYAYDTGEAWLVDWFDGEVWRHGKAYGHGSWPVRGGQ
jgi:hypothetical protein